MPAGSNRLGRDCLSGGAVWESCPIGAMGRGIAGCCAMALGLAGESVGSVSVCVCVCVGAARHAATDLQPVIAGLLASSLARFLACCWLSSSNSGAQRANDGGLAAVGNCDCPIPCLGAQHGFRVIFEFFLSLFPFRQQGCGLRSAPRPFFSPSLPSSINSSVGQW